MVLMERIVRPHLPIASGPSKTAAKCQKPEENKVAKFDAPSNAASPNYSSPSSNPNNKQKPTEKTRNSSWAYAYKKYMTKKETEQDKCKDEEDRIVGGASATDKPVSTAPTTTATT